MINKIKYCSVPGCKKIHSAKGYCTKHYQQMKIRGSISYDLPGHRRLISFYSNIKIIEDTGCWEWTKALNNKGYGKTKHQGKYLLAHRLSWILTNGEIPNKNCCLHRCDNPKCVNPNHLYLGTMLDNSRDMRMRHRNKTGEKHPRAKLNNEKVLEIRRLCAKGITFAEISRAYNMGQSVIRCAVNKTTWRNV